jgi:hypothetical protein
VRPGAFVGLEQRRAATASARGATPESRGRSSGATTSSACSAGDPPCDRVERLVQTGRRMDESAVKGGTFELVIRAPGWGNLPRRRGVHGPPHAIERNRRVSTSAVTQPECNPRVTRRWQSTPGGRRARRSMAFRSTRLPTPRRAGSRAQKETRAKRALVCAVVRREVGHPLVA